MAKLVLRQITFRGLIAGWLSDLFYAFCRVSLWGVFHLLFRVRVVGVENCPREGGPLLVVSNHLSEWDPPFLGTFVPWQVHWLAKVELFELAGGRMNGFFRTLHCVPVDREKTDFSAVKEVVRLLRGRRPVVIFAEGGTRTDETSLLGSAPELKEGAASMAILAGCPVLPVLLNGTFALYDWRNWLRRPVLELVIGPAYRPASRDRAEATAEMMRRLLELKPRLLHPHVR